MYIRQPVKTALYCALAAIAVWLFFRYLLVWFAPLIIALFMAAFLEPPVRFLSERLRFPRNLASGLCSILLIGGIVLMLVLVVGRAFSELVSLLGHAPELLNALTSSLDRFELSARSFIESTPLLMSGYLLTALESLPGQIGRMLGDLSAGVLTWLSSIAGKTPEILLFAATCGIGVYFISVEYPGIKPGLSRLIPDRWHTDIEAFLKNMCSALMSWLNAQFIMMGITFGELVLAFTLLRVDYAIFLALAVALVDALPVFGTGTVLLPWALVSLLSGDMALAIGLVVTYFAVSLVRNLVQAKLVGEQLGLHPVATLAAIYAGFCVSGVWGMLLAPLIAIMFKQLGGFDLIKNWQ